MKRRRFVAIGTTGLLATAIPWACMNQGDVDYEAVLAQPNSLSGLLNVEQVTGIGNSYLKNAADENNIRSLVDGLMKDISNTETGLPEAITNQIKTDFETGNTMMIDGWVLSRFEARQCALSALTNLS